jgi:hypothetical protein
LVDGPAVAAPPPTDSLGFHLVSEGKRIVCKMDGFPGVVRMGYTDMMDRLLTGKMLEIYFSPVKERALTPVKDEER